MRERKTGRLTRRVYEWTLIGITSATIAACNGENGPTGPTTITPTENRPPSAENRAPEPVGIPSAVVLIGGWPTTIDMGLYFRDPDSDRLRFEAESSDPRTITAEMQGNSLTLRLFKTRPATVTVTAIDPGGLTATPDVQYRIDRGTGLRGDISRKVWSINAPEGTTYEYEAACKTDDGTGRPEDCFLMNITDAEVRAPNGKVFKLDRDFGTQAYSGASWARWVLYGRVGEGLPSSGTYTFRYYTDGVLDYEETVEYIQRIIGYPTNVTPRREGNDLIVEWTPPADVGALLGGNNVIDGKVLLFPDHGEIISVVYEWGTREVRLTDIPMRNGDAGWVNVTNGVLERPAGGGIGQSSEIRITW